MREISKMNRELEQTYSELEEAYAGTMEALRLTVDAKDEYTKNHSDRVALYSSLIGEKLGLSEEDQKTLHDGALFHDIGKIGIPDSILWQRKSIFLV